MRTTHLSALVLTGALGLGISLVACGDDGDSTDTNDDNDDTPLIDAAAIDAPALDAPALDAPGATVMMVTCPATPALTIGTGPGNAYNPTTGTIAVGDIVRFQLGGSHNVVPHPTMPSDPGLRLGFGANACLQFTVAGAFTFQCQPHAPGMRGTITVQ